MDIFVSYAGADRAVAERLVASLGRGPWKVFFDRRIGPGTEWSEELLRELRDARCVLVLWSAASRGSFWVRAEAAEALTRDTYFPVSLDDASPLPPFDRVQALPIAAWVASGAEEDLAFLRAELSQRIDELPMVGNLEPVEDGAPLRETHLHLVHSAWRVNRETRFGPMPYRIHVILYGHASALARVVSVRYRLPGYPEGHDSQPGGPRERLFELKELANGLCVCQAYVEVAGQPRGHKRVLVLTRLLNMSESGPRLEQDFMRRRLPRSSIGGKLHSPREAIERAAELLAGTDPRTAVRRLVADGVPRLMAESAVWEARKDPSTPSQRAAQRDEPDR